MAAEVMLTQEIRRLTADLLGVLQDQLGSSTTELTASQRDPSVGPLNLIQVQLLRRVRQEDDDDTNRLRDLLRLSTQGISAGMRATG